MKAKALAIANNDIVYLWWTYPDKIPDCLGFSVRRLEKGKAPAALPAFVGFDPPKKNVALPTKPTTDLWPIQAYQWKDLFVPEETEVHYEIVPMTGTPGKPLTGIPGLSIKTNTIKATDRFGRLQVVFNRGIISTQALTKELPKTGGGPSAGALRTHIGKPGDPIRKGLAGEAVGTLIALLDRARAEGGRCFCALYELTDPELIAALEKAKGHVEVILSNADHTVEAGGGTTKIIDGTNAEHREALRKILKADLHDRILPKGNFIGHNKFVVYTDAQGKARAVLTGSTNWTPTGLCAQTNNALLIEHDGVARRYLEYWRLLLADDAQQGPALRQADAGPPPSLTLGAGQGKIRVWFSPNTERKTKPATNPPTPPDMAEVFRAIGEAEHGVLFLLFNPGAPSILHRLEEVSRQRQQAGAVFFVRGAVSDAKIAGEFGTRVYNDSVLKGPNRLITGVGGIPDQFSFWEEELARLGHAVIHDKVVVIDPFSHKCVVVTGSHNLGFKASYSNDENLCIIRGNRPLAEAYAAHVLDVVNHFNFRHKLTQLKEAGQDFKKGFRDLRNSDRWQDKYFKGHFLASRDQFFFP